MTYIIFKDEEEINRIEADEDFVAGYCEENGYTYAPQPIPEPEPRPEPEPEPTYDEIFDALLGTNENTGGVP